MWRPEAPVPSGPVLSTTSVLTPGTRIGGGVDSGRRHGVTSPEDAMLALTMPAGKSRSGNLSGVTARIRPLWPSRWNNSAGPKPSMRKCDDGYLTLRCVSVNTTTAGASTRPHHQASVFGRSANGGLFRCSTPWVLRRGSLPSDDCGRRCCGTAPQPSRDDRNTSVRGHPASEEHPWSRESWLSWRRQQPLRSP